MKSVVVACAVLAALLPGPAGAGVPEPLGLDCGFTSVSSPQHDVYHYGELDGGPIVVAELPVLDVAGEPTLSWDLLGNPVSATMRCDLQVNFSTHDGPDEATAAGSGTTVVVVPPTTVVYSAGLEDVLVVCTSVTVTDARGNTGTFYLDPSAADQWSTDSGASCLAAVGPCCEPITTITEAADEFFVEVVDPIVCPVLQTVFPPEGDMAIWNCPPYWR